MSKAAVFWGGQSGDRGVRAAWALMKATDSVREHHVRHARAKLRVLPFARARNVVSTLMSLGPPVLLQALSGERDRLVLVQLALQVQQQVLHREQNGVLLARHDTQQTSASPTARKSNKKSKRRT